MQCHLICHFPMFLFQNTIFLFLCICTPAPQQSFFSNPFLRCSAGAYVADRNTPVPSCDAAFSSCKSAPASAVRQSGRSPAFVFICGSSVFACAAFSARSSTTPETCSVSGWNTSAVPSAASAASTSTQSGTLPGSLCQLIHQLYQRRTPLRILNAFSDVIQIGFPEIREHRILAPDLRESGTAHLAGDLRQILHRHCAERTRPRFAAVFLGIVQPAAAVCDTIPCRSIRIRQEIIPQQAQLRRRCPALLSHGIHDLRQGHTVLCCAAGLRQRCAGLIPDLTAGNLQRNHQEFAIRHFLPCRYRRSLERLFAFQC